VGGSRIAAAVALVVDRLRAAGSGGDLDAPVICSAAIAAAAAPARPGARGARAGRRPGAAGARAAAEVSGGDLDPERAGHDRGFASAAEELEPTGIISSAALVWCGGIA